jgi:transcriptional regulator with XRE-family HTH domain
MNLTGTSGGNRLRALRNYYGKTQLTVELEANLGMGYLQRIETGKVQQPEQDTLERILAALGAQYSERRELLEMFGYLVGAPIPSATAINWAVAACQTELDSAVFPAYLLDCAHRLLTWNNLVPKLLDLDHMRQQAKSEHVSLLKAIFDPAYQFASRIINQEVFFLAQIRALRYERQRFQDEPWYTTLIQEMLQGPEFEHYWTNYPSAQTFFAARPLTLLQLDSKEVGALQFRLISESFVQDRRFRVIYYLPADAKTIQHCLQWVGP